MTRRDIGLILAGVLLASGIIFVIVGFMYKDSSGSYIQAKYFPPVFNIPKEVNRDFVIDIVDLVNVERNKLNVRSLKESSALSYAAYLRAKEILNNQEFNHYASGSGDIKARLAIETVGYRYFEIGENLARGYDDPNLVIEGWLNSADHKKNMLKDDYKEVGVAVLEGLFEGYKEKIIVLLLGEP